MSDPIGNVVIAGFTEDQAHRLTKVSVRQLRYWATEGFFVPSLDLAGAGFGGMRLYSFRDLVCLRVVSTLRNEVGASLQHLREVKMKLAHLGDDLWAKTTLFVLNKRVVIVNPETGTQEEAVSGQGVLQIPLAVVSSDMTEAVRAMRARPENDHGRIDIKASGKKNPVIAGTRIPVRSIQDFAASGYTAEQIVAQYPALTVADVEAAIGYRIAA
jgi:DNA-binding transcriptional MerR regulator